MIHNNYKYWKFLSRLSETGVCRLRATLLLQLLKRLPCAFLSGVWVTDIWWPGIFSKTAFWKQSILGPLFLDIKPNQKMLASWISASIYKGAFKRCCSAARLSFSSWSCAFGMHSSGCLTWLQAGPNPETTCNNKRWNKCMLFDAVYAVPNMGGWATPKWFARQTSIAKPLSISKCHLANWETLPHLQFLVFFLQGLDTFLVGIGMACAGDTKPSFRCKKIKPQTKGHLKLPLW